MAQTIEGIGRMVDELVDDHPYANRLRPVAHKLLVDWKTQQWRGRSGGGKATTARSLADRIRGSFCKTVAEPHITQTFKADDETRMAALTCLGTLQEALAVESSDEALAREKERRSAEAMKREILDAFEVIRRVGRGLVYLGSARTKEGNPIYDQGVELSREAALLLGSPSWSGAGPGQMEAGVRGPAEIRMPVGGVKIGLPHTKYEQSINPYIPKENVTTAVYFAPRKVGLVDAGIREQESERTAYIAFPGGFGTMDELFEVLTLEQMGKLGSKFPVPVLLMNYDGFYDSLLLWLDRAVEERMLTTEERARIIVCRNNREALEYLAGFYGIPEDQRHFRDRLRDFSAKEFSEKPVA